MPKTYYGRFVHYTYPTAHPLAGQVFPAIVTRDYPPVSEDGDDAGSEPARVDLCAFTPTPEAWSQVSVLDKPTRGCAHAAQTSDGSFSKVRFVAADEESQVAEEFNAVVDALPAVERPFDQFMAKNAATPESSFAPELPGAGEPIVEASNEPATNVLVSATDLDPEDAAALEAEIAAEESDDTQGDGGAAPI